QSLVLFSILKGKKAIRDFGNSWRANSACVLSIRRLTIGSSMRWLPALLAGFWTSASSALGADPVDYLRDVKPILSQHCYSCHGPQKQKSGLRLDTAGAARKGGNSGPAIVPGKSEESLLIKAVVGSDESLPRMQSQNPPLDDKQIALLKTWINQSATATA